MQLELINKLFLELSQFATAKTERELQLESEALDGDKLSVLGLLMHDSQRGWGELSSGLTQDFDKGQHSFNVRFTDGTEQRVTFNVTEL